MWTWAEWLSRSPYIWELLLCYIKLKPPSRLSRCTPIFCNLFYLVNPTPLLPCIMDSWIHSFFKLNGTKDLGRVLRYHQNTCNMSILPALLFAAGWRSVLPVGVTSSFWKLRRFQVYQLLKATCYLPLQAFNSMQLPKTLFLPPSWLV